MKLIFERSKNGKSCCIIPPSEVPYYDFGQDNARELPLHLPELTEGELSRHYTELEKNTFGVNSGFYPLGSCTMKYNPKINEDVASLPNFADIHPLQPAHTVQGCLKAINLAEQYFCEITGMDNMTFQPAAGAHGEFAGLLLIKRYHDKNNDPKRTKILVPDTAHGTNPASVTMAGFKSVSIPSSEDGTVDMEALKAALGEDIAGLMLTNPNTLGIFEKNILEIERLVHEAGGLVYYDGANLNPIMGVARPGDMGFDIVHLNLHKTFSTPHGGGGPGSGPIGCKAFLSEFLPVPKVVEKDGLLELSYDFPESMGSVKEFYGHFLIVMRALTYAITLGGDGIRSSAQNAVLNANYLMKHLEDVYDVAYPGTCMHEFVLSLERLKKETGVSAMDISKGILDYGMHPPTMYFPINVHEALMVEPTETESKETLDTVIKVYRELHERALTDAGSLHEAPLHTLVRRLDEVTAARNPILKYDFEA